MAGLLMGIPYRVIEELASFALFQKNLLGSVIQEDILRLQR